MPVASDSFITVQEADEVVSAPTGAVKQLRTPLMITLGALMIVVATLLILLLLSLRGSRTGLQSILPFLGSKQLDSLQIN